MPSFTITDKAKAKIENRYKIIVAIFLLMIIAEIADRLYHGSFIPRDAITHQANLFLIILIPLFFINLLYYEFSIQPSRLSRIIQSIEISDDAFKVTTFGFNIKYFPIKRKAVTFEVKKEDVVYRKLIFSLRINDNLPFAGSYAIKNKEKDYYLVPSLFDEEDKVMIR